MSNIPNQLPVNTTVAFSTPKMGQRRVTTVYWFNPGNIGDLVNVTDDQGNSLWQGRCEAVNESQVFRFPSPFTIQGWAVPTLGSGTLYLYG